MRKGRIWTGRDEHMDNAIFESQKISKAYLKLALPLVLSMVVTLVYNLADTFFVAQTNDTDLVAGVSLGAPLFTFLMAFGNIFAQGGCSLISRLMGEKNDGDVRRVSSFCFYVTLLCGVVTGALLLLLRDPMLRVLGADADTWRHASDYYTWLSLGAPLVMVSFIHSNLLRSEGMSKESMFGTVTGAVINIILDPILISGLGLGAAGAAIATLIGYVGSVSFFAWVVCRKSRKLSLSVRECSVTLPYAAQILGIGIPAALSNVMSSVAVILVNQFLLPYGNEKIAAMGIVLKSNMIVLLVLTGLAFGGQPLYGYCYGAKDGKRLRELMWFCVRFIGGVALLLSAVVFAVAPQLLRIFMDNDQIVSDGTVMLRLQVVSMVFAGMVLMMTIVCQSIGAVKESFLLSICRQGVVFFAVLFVMNRLFGYEGVLASQAVADVLSAAIALGIFLRLRRRIFQTAQ